MSLKLKQNMSILLAVATILTSIVWPTAISDEYEVEAAISSTYCEHGGSTEQLGYRGCSYCGGKGSYYDKGPRRGHDDLQEGNGWQRSTKSSDTYTDDEGYTWQVIYRCENCGDTGYDCKKETEKVGEICIKKGNNSMSPIGVGYINYNGSSTAAEGKVPIRWCTHCGPVLASKNQAYETVAKWAQLHLDPEPTPAPEYTVKINIVPEGAGIPIGEGTYKVGSSVTVNASENIGWKFVGWQGVTSGLKNGNKSFNTGPVANTFKMPKRNVELTAIFEEDDDGVSPEVTTLR